jgi:hypothetical protein
MLPSSVSPYPHEFRQSMVMPMHEKRNHSRSSNKATTQLTLQSCSSRSSPSLALTSEFGNCDFYQSNVLSTLGSDKRCSTSSQHCNDNYFKRLSEKTTISSKSSPLKYLASLFVRTFLFSFNLCWQSVLAVATVLVQYWSFAPVQWHHYFKSQCWAFFRVFHKFELAVLGILNRGSTSEVATDIFYF